MLVLSRREGEALRIGDSIVLTVQRIKGNRVTIGLEGPDHVRFVRVELEREKPEGNSNED